MNKIAICFLGLAGTALGQEPLEEIIVTGEFRDTELHALPASISVLDGEVIEDRAARHLEEVLALIPNVNLAGGSTRRFRSAASASAVSSPSRSTLPSG
jgi:outer membrane receptor for ferrienterochelin and colicin